MSDGMRIAALKAVVDLARLEITLAMASIVLSGTLLGLEQGRTGSKTQGPLIAGPALDFLVAAWILLGLVVVFGVLTVARYVEVVGQDDGDAGALTLVVLGVLQQLALISGIILFGLFAYRMAT